MESITQQIFLMVFIRNICCVIDSIPVPIYLYRQWGWHISELGTKTSTHSLDWPTHDL